MGRRMGREPRGEDEREEAHPREPPQIAAFRARLQKKKEG